MFDYCHPGEILREECLKESKLTITDAAKKLGVTRQTLSEVVNEKRGISIEMALRLAKAFNTTPELWLNMQQKYDLAQVKQKVDLSNVEIISKSA